MEKLHVRCWERQKYDLLLAPCEMAQRAASKGACEGALGTYRRYRSVTTYLLGHVISYLPSMTGIMFAITWIRLNSSRKLEKKVQRGE